MMATCERRSSSESDRSTSSSNNNIIEDLGAVSVESPPTFLNNQPNDSTPTDCTEMDRFLQQRKSDLMFELRNIQHGERPVTGQNHRENLQHFMEKHMPFDSTNATAASKGHVANVDNVEDHRPEAVVVEVQGIIEQRPVSSILQSAAFRRQLENVIRGSIQTTRRQVARDAARVASSVAAARQQQQRIRATAPSTNTPVAPTRTQTNRTSMLSAAASTVVEPPRPVVEERPTLVRSESTESIESFSSARSSLNEDNGSDFEYVEEEEVVTPPAGTENTASSFLAQPSPHPQQPSLSQSEPHVQQQPEAERQIHRGTWNDFSQRQREELVEEISELLHSRLVSSTLDGEFRATLEYQIQDRLTQAGGNGQAVQEFIRTLPHSGVPRNDFTHLGIAPDNDNWDNVSVTSVSAHSIPYAQTNSYLGREIQGLKSQMNEMKNMLKLTFDMQMDIQRAVRQEVAAAMNLFTAQAGSGATAAATPNPTPPINDTHCLICLERHTDTVLYQCGHMCVCYTCGRDLVSRGHNCPVCRAPIKDVIRAYKTNAE